MPGERGECPGIGLRPRVVGSGHLSSGADILEYFKNEYMCGWALPRMEK